LAHNFNHNTHHRGQISAAVTQFGLPAPEMGMTYYLDAFPNSMKQLFGMVLLFVLLINKLVMITIDLCEFPNNDNNKNEMIWT
jgi:hypothetical protein